jgi:hypothetical protein
LTKTLLIIPGSLSSALANASFRGWFHVGGWRATQRPQRILQALRERHKALAAEHHRQALILLVRKNQMLRLRS